MFFGLFGKKSAQSYLELEPGHEVELEVVSAQEKEIYITEVVRMDKKTISLALPGDGRGQEKFKPGTFLMAHTEIEGQIGSFQTSVVSSGGSPPVLVLSQPRKVEWREKSAQEKQRRNFVRFATTLPVQFSVSPGVERQGTTIDISGNGLSMVADLQIAQGKTFPVHLKLPEKEIKITGKVIRSQPFSRPGTVRGKFETAMTFINIEPKDQDLIVRYIFERQRELRRRGLL